MARCNYWNVNCITCQWFTIRLFSEITDNLVKNEVYFMKKNYYFTRTKSTGSGPVKTFTCSYLRTKCLPWFRCKIYCNIYISKTFSPPGRVAQSVGHLTHKSGVLGSIPGLATYFRFSFRFFKKGSCQLLAKVCARSTG